LNEAKALGQKNSLAQGSLEIGGEMNQMTTQFLQHELSSAFPAMPAKELAALVADVKENGQRDPGVMFEGKVLDGWHRCQACIAAEVPFKFVELPEGIDPVAFVMSRNLHRRHMTDSQRAAAVVACSRWAPRGKPVPGTDLQTTAQLAKEADVSEKTIRRAKTAQTAGLGPAVIEGRVSVKQAAEIAKSDPKAAKKIAAGGEIPKIVPRREAPAKAEVKSAVDPLDKAREFANEQRAKIKALRADLAKRDATIESLNGLLAESRDNARDLADSLEAALKSGEGDAAVAKEIKKLTGQIRVLESQRDQYMTKCNELVKSVKALERKLDKCEAKK
jgi:hypothetical protein